MVKVQGTLSTASMAAQSLTVSDAGTFQESGIQKHGTDRSDRVHVPECPGHVEIRTDNLLRRYRGCKIERRSAEFNGKLRRSEARFGAAFAEPS